MDNSSMAMIIGIVAIFAGASFVYVILMVFFPEWVGITGKVALENEASHKDGTEVQDNFAFNENNRPTGSKEKSRPSGSQKDGL
ncbi:MAG: hypothetical protein KF681_01165 [Bdellovibrionaceae bacterium]|nr:hypothetical protein [Pseudobdellovibrionaceae bacterium]